MKIDKTPAFSIAYSYLRFSSPAQEEGDSLRRQTALREGWLRRHPGVTLDTSLELTDAGVSGYTGQHRKNKRHALARFLDLVDRGRVLAGSYLIVENLDRLTRENPVVSIPAVLSLIGLGIRVVQLAPTEIVYDSDMEQHHLMNMLWELARGHGESKRKSTLLAPVWEEKKSEARLRGKPLGRMCPGWIELVDGSYRLKEGAAETIRQIFRWSAAGLGSFLILERLIRLDIPSFNRSKQWSLDYITKLLNNRAVLGEYQPHKGSHGRNRQPVGEPVPSYYPSAIDLSLWFTSHSAMARRTRRSGRPSIRSQNPFSGLLFDALDGGKLVIQGSHGRGYPYLVNRNALEKKHGTEWRSFPLVVFTEGILSMLQELSASALFDDPNAERISVLTGRLIDAEKRLGVAIAKFEEDPESQTWSAKVSQYDREKRAILSELKETEIQSQHQLSATWQEALALMKTQDPARLRSSLLDTVESVWCVFANRGWVRLAAIQCWFRGGGRHRDYVIGYRRGSGNAASKKESERWRDSFVSASDGELDFREKRHAELVKKVLAEMSLADFLTEGRRF